MLWVDSIVRITWPALAICLIAAAAWKFAPQLRLPKALAIQAKFWTLAYAALFLMLVVMQVRLLAIIHYYSTTQWHASDHQSLQNGIAVSVDVTPAVPPPNAGIIPFEFDESDSLDLVVRAQSNSNRACPIHLDDFTLTTAAPAFALGPSLTQISRCSIRWNYILSPLRAGIESVDVGVRFGPRWLTMPEYRVLRTSLRIIAPSSVWSSQQALILLSGLVSLVISIIVARLSKPKDPPSSGAATITIAA